MLRDRLRICIDGPTPDERSRLAAAAARRFPPPKLPWEYESADEVLAAPTEQKLLSALEAGLPLPERAQDVTDESAARRLEPLLDEGVRRDLRVRRVSGARGARATFPPPLPRRRVLCGRARPPTWARARSRQVLENGRDDGTATEGRAPGAFADGAAELYLVEAVVAKRDRTAREGRRAASEGDLARAARLQSQVLAENAYLDELLEQLAVEGARDEGGAREESDAYWLEQVLRSDDGAWYEGGARPAPPHAAAPTPPPEHAPIPASASPRALPPAAGRPRNASPPSASAFSPWRQSCARARRRSGATWSSAPVSSRSFAGWCRYASCSSCCSASETGAAPRRTRCVSSAPRRGRRRRRRRRLRTS
eukprot:1530700-Prymnesium_polylepis.1